MDTNDEPVLEVFHSTTSFSSSNYTTTPLPPSMMTVDANDNDDDDDETTDDNNDTDIAHNLTRLPPLVSNIPILTNTNTVDINFNDNNDDDEETAREEWDRLEQEEVENHRGIDEGNNNSMTTIPTIKNNTNQPVTVIPKASTVSVPKNSSSSVDPLDITYKPFRTVVVPSSSTVTVNTNNNNNNNSGPDEFDQEIKNIQTNNPTASSLTTVNKDNSNSNNNNNDDDEFDTEFESFSTTTTTDNHRLTISSSASAATAVSNTSSNTISSLLSTVVLNVTAVPVTINPTNINKPLVESTTESSVSTDTVPSSSSSSSSSFILANMGDALRSLQSSLAMETVTTTDTTGSSNVSATTTGTDKNKSGTVTTVEPSIVPLVPPKAPLAALTEKEEDEDEDDDNEEDEEINEDKDNGKQVPPHTTATVVSTPIHPSSSSSSVNVKSSEDDTEHEELEEAFNTATTAHYTTASSSSAYPSGGIFRSSSPTSSTAPSIQLVSFIEAATYLLSPDQIAPYRKSIIVHNPPDPNQSNHCFSWFSTLFDTPLREGCWYERDAVFSTAKMTYQSNDTIHIRLMRSLYSLITGKDIQQPISSWVDIGFQRDGEFVTDLRAGGMLGPLQMLYLIDTYPWLIRLLSMAASSPIRGFPLMVTAINFTARTLQCLRNGTLNRTCNRAFEVANHLQRQRKHANTSDSTSSSSSSSSSLPLAPSVVSTVVNDLYCALLYNFVEEYENRKGSIQSIGIIMQEVTNQCTQFPDRSIDNLRAENRRQLTENSQPKVIIGDGATIDPMVGSKLTGTMVKSSPPSARSLITNNKGSTGNKSSSPPPATYQRNFSEL